MLLFDNEHTIGMILQMVVEEKGKGWKVITPPANPTNTNFMNIVDVDVIIPKPTTRKILISANEIPLYSIDINQQLHKRSNCDCFKGIIGGRVNVNFIDDMGLRVEDVKFLGENDLNLVNAPCMIEELKRYK